jgi:hypothetical protein
MSVRAKYSVRARYVDLCCLQEGAAAFVDATSLLPIAE